MGVLAMPSSSAAAPAGHGPGELFFLSDEQILEIAPDGNTNIPGSAPEATPRPAEDTAARTVPAAEATPQSAGIRSIGNTPPSASAAPPGTAVLSEPPPVLAQMMADPESGAEARELWSGIQEARAEVAAYRACFASPEEARALKELYPGGAAEARAAAERARMLDEIDAAYFGGSGSSPEQASAARAAFAERLLRENPAAFREMVFAGLRALENAAAVSEAAPVSPAAPRTQGVKAEPPFGAAASGPVHASPVASDPALSAYAAFEQAANADLERSVGDSIERTIARALPNLAKDEASAGARPGSVPLRDRLAAVHPAGCRTGAPERPPARRANRANSFRAPLRCRYARASRAPHRRPRPADRPRRGSPRHRRMDAVRACRAPRAHRTLRRQLGGQGSARRLGQFV